LQVLLNLRHRGACGSEQNTGDGAGITLQLPHRFFADIAEKMGMRLPAAGEYGAGVAFLPNDPDVRARCEGLIETITCEEGQHVLGWRSVPVDDSALGRTARESQPVIRQFFIGRGPDVADELAFERKLYVI